MNLTVHLCPHAWIHLFANKYLTPSYYVSDAGIGNTQLWKAEIAPVIKNGRRKAIRQ